MSRRIWAIAGLNATMRGGCVGCCAVVEDAGGAMAPCGLSMRMRATVAAIARAIGVEMSARKMSVLVDLDVGRPR